MFKNIKIGSKVTLLVLLLVVLAVYTVSFLAFDFSKRAVRERYQENLEVIADLKGKKVEEYFNSIVPLAQMVSRLDTMKSIIEQSQDSSVNVQQLFLKAADFAESLLSSPKINNILVTDPNGKILFDARHPEFMLQNKLFQDPYGKILANTKDTYYISDVFLNDDEYFVYISIPVYNNYQQKLGLFLCQINMQPVYQMLQDSTGLGETGEIILTAAINNKALYINPLRHYPQSTLRKGFEFGDLNDLPVQDAAKGNKGVAEMVDYRNEDVLAAWNSISQPKWGVVAKIDDAEIYAETQTLLYKFLIAGTIVLIISVLIALVFSKVLINPVHSLMDTMNLLRKGILPGKVKVHSNDEIGQIASAVGNLVEGLKGTADFAHKIGEGNLTTEFTPLSSDDTLGTSLINMRDNIREAEKRDKQRNWIVTGLAEISEILRTHDNLEELGDAILNYISEKIGAIQGAFYIVDDNKELESDQLIRMKASYAYGKKKYLKAEFKFAEGLVGQAAVEQDTLLRVEIPDEYVTITSGLLGDQRPKCLMIVPLMTDEKVFGVMEFAAFTRFDAGSVKFVEELSLIIARTIFNIKVNERTKKLLSESQSMSHELQEQQEVLRQNAEEMEATQEELKRTNHRLEEQIEEVNRTQKRMQLLLENASEVITIYEEDGIVRYISPSVKKILGYSQNEMIGQKDIQNVHPEGVEAVEDMFKKLLINPKESVTIQYVYNGKDGKPIWLEATGKNFLSDTAIQGIIVNSRDITERRRAEQEERMRSKMQSLSENSPDLISRLDMEGNFFYINPVIESITGNKPEHYLNKTYKSVDLPEIITAQWTELLNKVNEEKQKNSTEINMPTAQGERIMQVNAIPEFDEKEVLESILMVSHDITERKMIELEIQSKNKSITESINYAKRIQGAILPDTYYISRILPESFILYKARDVVSGDFPWFLQQGDEIFIAAVDCTGHGVPGALISLIGYFLLNDIVRSRKITDPGEILDLLDEGVTETLKQGQSDSKTKDGMDISLCKIDLAKQEVEYAGAHRPLYIMKSEELEEIKGNKFPIGGGIYKNQTNFTNHKFNVEKGDSIFFCSDGFPDQFGGPDNRKYGPKRLREIIKETRSLKMDQVYQTISDSWEEWKGDQKQTDDVLLIGIRF